MDRVVAAIAGIVVLALAGAVTVLAWHGTINGQAAIGFFSTLTLGGIIGGVGHVASNSGARAALSGRERPLMRAPVAASRRKPASRRP